MRLSKTKGERLDHISEGNWFTAQISVSRGHLGKSMNGGILKSVTYMARHVGVPDAFGYVVAGC